jgi:hypothetical protein
MVFFHRSPVPSSQLRALHVLALIKKQNPVYADILCDNPKHGDVREVVQDVRDQVHYIDAASMHSEQARSRVWRNFYVDKFNRRDLDALLASSRKALFCVEENELNGAAKTLYHLRFARTQSQERAYHFEQGVQTLARCIVYVIYLRSYTRLPCPSNTSKSWQTPGLLSSCDTVHRRTIFNANV